MMPTAAAQQAAADAPTPPPDADADADATEAEVAATHARLDAEDKSLADDLDTYEERVAWMFITLQEFNRFTHEHQMIASSGIDAAYRKRRVLMAHSLALEVERAMLVVIVTKRRRTYGHDMVYGLAGLYMLLGKPYLGACENNEHAHKEMKYFFRHMSSKSSKKRSACLQTLDLMTAKRLLVDGNAADLPRTTRRSQRERSLPSGKKPEGARAMRVGWVVRVGPSMFRALRDANWAYARSWTERSHGGGALKESRLESNLAEGCQIAEERQSHTLMVSAISQR